jgi:hypothetical protein
MSRIININIDLSVIIDRCKYSSITNTEEIRFLLEICTDETVNNIFKELIGVTEDTFGTRINYVMYSTIATHPKTYLETIKQLIAYLKDSKSVNHSLSKTDVYRIFELIAKRKDLDDELFKIMSGFRHDGIRQNLATNETTPHVYLKHIIATSKNNHTVELAKQTLNKCLE